jgi:hypothetical protein
VKGVDSFNATVTNNFFQNIYQVTTTSNTYDHGGTANYLFQNNNIVHLKGSIKFASRTAGATNVVIRSNTISDSALDGYEISSYVNVQMTYNNIMNIARNAVNCYTNDRVTLGGFNWGDNFLFQGNVIDTAGTGLRISPNPYSDGFKPVPRNVRIISNTFRNISGTPAAVTVSNGIVSGMVIARNKLNNIASKRYFNIAGGSQGVSITDNMVDNKAYVAAK